MIANCGLNLIPLVDEEHQRAVARLKQTLKEGAMSAFQEKKLSDHDIVNFIPSLGMVLPVYRVAGLSEPNFDYEIDTPEIALEVEQETLINPGLPTVPGFKVTADASLRHYGFEYVSVRPLPVDRTLAYVTELYAQFKSRNFQLLSSIRCSTHVHFNVSKHTLPQVFSFAILYWLIEPYLSNFAGEHRKGNVFCLRLSDARSLLHNLFETFERAERNERNFFRYPLFLEGNRYSSVNFNALVKFNSLEFRLFRGTEDPEEIRLWIKAIEAIYLFALKYPSPKQILSYFFKECPCEELYEQVLGKEVTEQLQKYQKPSMKDVVKSTRSLAAALFPLMTSKYQADYPKIASDGLVAWNKAAAKAAIAVPKTAQRNTPSRPRPLLLFRRLNYTNENLEDNINIPNPVPDHIYGEL
jgi:Putative amidoligase enzyme